VATPIPDSTNEALMWCQSDSKPRKPAAITVNEQGRWPEITAYEWETADEPAAV
jgi:hypothetical protein